MPAVTPECAKVRACIILFKARKSGEGSGAMETKNADMQQVMDRLERVERQNRWLVRGGLVLVLSCGSVLLMAQKPLARSIEAEKFVLKDTAGKVTAELHMTDSGPELALYSTSKVGARANLFVKEGETGLVLYGGEGTGLSGFIINQDGPILDMDKAGTGRSNGGLSAQVSKDGPKLFLVDREGFEVSVGNQTLVTPTTGEKTQTSAASIHLFDPKGKTLWTAP